jgi:hypothetical protein
MSNKRTSLCGFVNQVSTIAEIVARHIPGPGPVNEGKQ